MWQKTISLGPPVHRSDLHTSTQLDNYLVDLLRPKERVRERVEDSKRSECVRNPWKATKEPSANFRSGALERTYDLRTEWSAYNNINLRVRRKQLKRRRKERWNRIAERTRISLRSLEKVPRKTVDALLFVKLNLTYSVTYVEKGTKGIEVIKVKTRTIFYLFALDGAAACKGDSKSDAELQSQ